MKDSAHPRQDIGWRGRLVALALGMALILYGYVKIKQGRPIYKSYRQEDVNAQFVMILGGLALLFAVFPWGRIGFLWEGKPQKREVEWQRRRNRPRKLH